MMEQTTKYVGKDQFLVCKYQDNAPQTMAATKMPNSLSKPFVAPWMACYHNIEFHRRLALFDMYTRSVI